MEERVAGTGEVNGNALTDPVQEQELQDESVNDAPVADDPENR